jgi:WD40 repeat protein
VPLAPDAPPPAGVHTVTTSAGVTVSQSSVARTIGSLQGHRADVRAVAVSADGSLVLSVAGWQARVWNAKSGACIRTLELGDAATVGLCAAFAPGSRHALIGTKAGRLLVFDLASTDLLEAHEAHGAALWSIAVRPDGRGCATGGADKEVKFWDFDLRAAGGDAAAEAAAGGRKAPAAAAAGGAKQLTLVHARTLKLTDEVLAVRYSHHADPAQLLFAAALLDATVRVFFDDTLKFFLSLYGHKLPVLAMDISADSTLLVTASADKNVKVRLGGRANTLGRRRPPEQSLPCSPPGRSGASTSATATSRSLRTGTRSCVRAYAAAPSPSPLRPRPPPGPRSRRLPLAHALLLLGGQGPRREVLGRGPL